MSCPRNSVNSSSRAAFAAIISALCCLSSERSVCRTAVNVTILKTCGMFGILVLHLSAAVLLFDRYGCNGQTAEVSSLTSQIGGHAVFECPAVPQPRYNDGGIRRLVAVRWTKDGQTVFTCSEGTLTTDERYDGRTTVVEPPDFNNAVSIAINVSSLRESDTGNYECHVTYSGDAGPLHHSSSRSPLPTLSSPQSITDSPLNAVDKGMVGGIAGVRFRLDVQGGDVMSIPPINQTRMEHESVHFSCVKEDPEFVVQWYKDGVPLDDLPFLSGRFLVTPEGSLDIYDAALNDNGFYSCRIISAKGTLSAGAFLNVQYKAKVVYSPAEVFLAYGKPGTLDCHFHSNPPLTKIRWEKDGFLFDTYNVPGVYHRLNGSLYFDRVEKEHGGKYTCTPFNELGTEGASTPMDVIVQHPPKLIVVPKVLYFCKLGDNITMPCEAENFDNRGPAIVWQKADGKSLFNPRITVNGGNLTLTGVRSEDRGVYRCVASNIAATISVETELIVEENLFHRKHFDLHVNATNKNIVAYWKRPYSFCTVWSRDTSSTSSNWNATATSSDGKAILWNLNIDGEYEIMVTCRDEMSGGESMFSRSILTSHLKEITGRSTDELHEKSSSLVHENHPFDIRVERSGTGYNVSWTMDKSSVEHRVKRYVVKWYDARDGLELGSASTTVNKRYIVVELAGGKTYGILVTATLADGRHTSVGSRSFHSPASALTATTTSSSPSTAFTKYYYMALFGLFITGFVVLCCNCHSGKGR